jgi:hypothetical protein
LLGLPVWPGGLIKGKDIIACRMTHRASDDELRDGTPSRRHHPKFNSRHRAG